MSSVLKTLICAATVVFALSIACNEDIAGPTPLPIPLPPPGPATKPSDPVFNPGVDFVHGTRGILVFAGTQATENEIQALDSRLRGLGWSRPSYHVCAEVADWEHTRWSDGPPAFSKENLENLDRFLAVTADLGSQVLLDVVCTIRDTSSFDRIVEFAQIIGNRIKDYDHVAVHIANEYWHPSSNIRNTVYMQWLRDTIRVAGFKGMIGTDDNAGRPGQYIYDPALRRLGFWTDFHPWRIPVPNRHDFRRMVQRNPEPVVISEPIAYSSEYGDEGCCTASREVIMDYVCGAELEDITMYYHSTDGLLWPSKNFEWIPGSCY